MQRADTVDFWARGWAGVDYHGGAVRRRGKTRVSVLTWVLDTLSDGHMANWTSLVTPCPCLVPVADHLHTPTPLVIRAAIDGVAAPGR